MSLTPNQYGDGVGRPVLEDEAEVPGGGDKGVLVGRLGLVGERACAGEQLTSDHPIPKTKKT